MYAIIKWTHKGNKLEIEFMKVFKSLDKSIKYANDVSHILSENVEYITENFEEFRITLYNLIGVYKLLENPETFIGIVEETDL